MAWEDKPLFSVLLLVKPYNHLTKSEVEVGKIGLRDMFFMVKTFKIFIFLSEPAKIKEKLHKGHCAV